MLLKNTELMKEFYEKEKEKYPDLTFSEFRDILFSPWNHLKTVITSGSFLNVRFHHFGIFIVYEDKIERALKKHLEKRNKRPFRDTPYYNKVMKQYKTYLRKMKEEEGTVSKNKNGKRRRI